MSSSFPIYRQQGSRRFTALILVLVVVVGFLFVGVSDIAFRTLGFTRMEFLIILLATFLGSLINFPLWKIKGVARVIDYEEVKVFWMSYRIPRIALREVSTLVTVNLGGAVIPILVSLYLLAIHPDQILYALIGIFITSLFVHSVARRVRGVGIVTPFLVPPIIAALIAYLLLPSSPAVLAYVCGTLGALIGADLTNLRNLQKLDAPVVSIGGAGTFDGVFLTGIIAVLLLWLI